VVGFSFFGLGFDLVLFGGCFDFGVKAGCSGGACSSSEKSKRGLLLMVIISFWALENPPW
jgi:hypothetical protein